MKQDRARRDVRSTTAENEPGCKALILDQSFPPVEIVKRLCARIHQRLKRALPLRTNFDAKQAIRLIKARQPILSGECSMIAKLSMMVWPVPLESALREMQLVEVSQGPVRAWRCNSLAVSLFSLVD